MNLYTCCSRLFVRFWRKGILAIFSAFFRPISIKFVTELVGNKLLSDYDFVNFGAVEAVCT